MSFPKLGQTVLDTTDARQLAEFYRQLFGFRYRPGDEPPTDGSADDAEWLVLRGEHGERQLAFQQTEVVHRTTWPDPEVPMQLHLDATVANVEELEEHRQRAQELGATLRLDRSDDPEEPLYVLADPAGHPFCLFVG